MHIRLRRIYYSTVIIIFLIFAPVIILYSMGWRYDFAGRTVVHTGVVTVSTQPERATVSIDGAMAAGKTPTVIKNVLPGRHKIEIQRDNYFSWYKWLQVDAAFATLVNDVVLLRDDRQHDILLAEPVAAVTWSYKQEILVYTLMSGEVFFAEKKDMIEGKSASSLQLVAPGSAPRVVWSPDDHRALLLPPDGSTWLLDVDTVRLEEIEEMTIMEARWQNNHTFLYQDRDNFLSVYDTDQHLRQLVSSEPVIDFYPGEKSFFVLRPAAEGGPRLFQLISGTEKLITEFDSGGDYHFAGIFSEILVVIDKGNALYFLEPGSLSWILDEVRADAQDMVWLEKQGELFFWNGFEHSFYNYHDQRSSTLLRSGSEIHDGLWHPRGKMFFLAIDDRLEARELDERDRVNTFGLWDSRVTETMVDADGHYLYFIDEADRQLKRLLISD